MMPKSETARVTSQARIKRLESDVSKLWTIVRSFEAKFGCVSTEVEHDQRPLSPVEKADGSDDDADSNVFDMSPTSPPSHLLPLFDNGLLRSTGHESVTSYSTPGLQKVHGHSSLRRLMPSREDMLTIIEHASSWLLLYSTLFPMVNATKTSEEMLLLYDKVQDPDADPVTISALLLYVAVTVQQSPDDTTGRAAESIKDASTFVKEVSDTVERLVVSNDALAGTLEGIQATQLFLRL